MSELAHNLVESLIYIQRFQRKLGVEKGRLLWMLRADNLYREAFGEGVDTWEEFLRSPEIALSVSEANRTMQLYEYFVLKSEIEVELLEEIPVKSLQHMLPRLKSGEVSKDELPEMIGAAQTLTFNEFKERLYDVVNKSDGTRTYTFVLMKRCNETGNLSRVVGTEHEDLLRAFPKLNNES